MTDFERLQIFAENKKTNVSRFSELAGFRAGYIASLKKPKASITITTLSKICAAFPDFDAVGFILSESAEEWQQCLAAKITPPPQYFDKNQIAERLLTFFKELGVGNIQLQVVTGIGKNYINSLKLSRAGFTTSTLRKIFAGFPQLNPEWLVLGKGQMLKAGTEQKPITYAKRGLKGLRDKLKQRSKKLTQLINQQKNHNKALIEETQKEQPELEKILAIHHTIKQQTKEIIKHQYALQQEVYEFNYAFFGYQES